MTLHPSRKHFLAKLLGVFAISSVGSKLVVDAGTGTAVGAQRPAGAPAGLELRQDPRTVARRADAV